MTNRCDQIQKQKTITVLLNERNSQSFFNKKKEISIISEYQRRDIKKILKAIEKIAKQISMIIFDNLRS